MEDKYMVVDVESNGLYGQPFIVCFYLNNKSVKKERDKITSFRCEIEGTVDPWIANNIIPVNQDIPVDCKSYSELLQKCYDFWIKHKESYPKVVSHMAYPVETNFFREMITKNSSEIFYDEIYPGFYDLWMLLKLYGETGDSVTSFLKKHNAMKNYMVHNCVDDCIAEAKAYEILKTKFQEVFEMKI